MASTTFVLFLVVSFLGSVVQAGFVICTTTMGSVPSIKTASSNAACVVSDEELQRQPLISRLPALGSLGATTHREPVRVAKTVPTMLSPA